MNLIVALLVAIFAALSNAASLSPAEKAAKGIPFRIRSLSDQDFHSPFNGLTLERGESNNRQYAPIFAKTGAVYFTLNDTQLLSQLTIGDSEPAFALGLAKSDDVYERWGRMLLTQNPLPKLSRTGFMFDQRGYIINHRPHSDFYPPEWAKWRLCHWNHEGKPELFWDFFNKAPLPCNCEFVHLVAEFFVD